MSDYLVIETALLGAAFLSTALLTPLCKNICRRVGLVDKPGTRKIHAQPVPYGGGIAIFTTFTVALPITLALFEATTENATALRHDLIVLLLGGGGMFLLGLADDWKRLSAPAKLLIQLIIILCVVSGGVRASFFSPQPWVGMLISIVWITGITNALNLLDNMNGQCAGVATVAAACFFTITTLTGQTLLAMAMSLVTGASVGFFIHNFPSAGVFLGNAGSYFLGYLLATLTILGTYYFERLSYPLIAVAVPVLVLAVPLFDTCGVILIRLKRGKPIFEGDTNHFAHRLVALGLSPAMAVLAILLLSAITGVAAIALYFVSSAAGAGLVLGIIALVIALVIVLEQAARKEQANP